MKSHYQPTPTEAYIVEVNSNITLYSLSAVIQIHLLIPNRQFNICF